MTICNCLYFRAILPYMSSSKIKWILSILRLSIAVIIFSSMCTILWTRSLLSLCLFHSPRARGNMDCWNYLWKILERKQGMLLVQLLTDSAAQESRLCLLIGCWVEEHFPSQCGKYLSDNGFFLVCVDLLYKRSSILTVFTCFSKEVSSYLKNVVDDFSKICLFQWFENDFLRSLGYLQMEDFLAQNYWNPRKKYFCLSCCSSPLSAYWSHRNGKRGNCYLFLKKVKFKEVVFLKPLLYSAIHHGS